ncbi:hypothetical protein [Aureivirga sp. CE67]|uniref:hypothetical protein n=1 Tax=Aureivirga sp. CE67 TaxID=1788983 RepID=UPI0018C8FB64|nr:hypothetical protein [Aureivirga sp. CE67]
MKQFNCVIILSLILFSSCNNFEKRFYNGITNKNLNAFKNEKNVFDLSSITNFEWEKVILIRGNESVPVYQKEIIEILKNTEGFKEIENFEVTEIPTFKDRFYFLTNDKEIITKEIESGIYNHENRFFIESCSKNRIWLTKNECQFEIKSDLNKKDKGTVILYPNCK